jgi:hypothetical protein
MFIDNVQRFADVVCSRDVPSCRLITIIISPLLWLRLQYVGSYILQT